MRTVVYRSYGKPADVLQVVETADPPAPAAGEVAIRVLSRPVHPGDLLGVEGRYRGPGDKSDVAHGGARPGFEGMGIVEALGASVEPESLKVGSRVAFFPVPGAWGERVNAPAAFVAPVPDDLADDIASQLHVNPLTAGLLLRAAQAAGVSADGDGTIVITAAAGAVPRLVTALAQRTGLPVLNLVRRSESIPELQALHHDVAVVATDHPDWQDQLRIAAGKRSIRVVLDPVGGDLASQMLELLAPGGTLVSFGDLSAQPIRVPQLSLPSRDIRLHGVSVGRWAALPAAVRSADIHAALDIARGRPELFSVAARYDLAEIRTAVAHAQQAAKQGTVLLTSR